MNTADQEAAAIELRGLTVCFGEHCALEDVSLTVPHGAFVAIVGPNGAGKSTLIKTILGLVKPSRGEVRVFSKPPEKLDPSLIGYVPQFKTLDRSFPALAEELVASGLRRAWPVRISRSERRRVGEALARVGAEHLARRSVSRFSGGELQRVYLARAFVRNPKLVILDEPATGIDVMGEADMYRLLEGYQKSSGATLLMITHDWEAAYHHSTHVIVLNRRLIGFGEPQRALSEKCLRQAFGHVGHEHTLSLTFGRRGSV